MSRSRGDAEARRQSRKVVFLDAGGTLIEPRASVGEIYAEGAAHFGVAADAAALDAGFRAAFAASPPLAFPGATGAELLRLEHEWWRNVVRCATAGCDFPDFEAYFRALFDDFGRGAAWRVFPDVIPVLDELRRRGVSLGMISNFDNRLEPILRDLGLRDYFESVTVSSAAGWAKPDARIFAVAMRTHGVADGDEVWHAGDSEHDDIGGARAAGIRGVQVRSNGAGLDSLLRE